MFHGRCLWLNGIPLQEVQSEKHLKTSERELLNAIKKDTDTILKEFLYGQDSYGLKDIIQTYPEACEPLFVTMMQLMQITCFHRCTDSRHSDVW